MPPNAAAQKQTVGTRNANGNIQSAQSRAPAGSYSTRKSERSHKHLISSLHRIGRPGPRPLTTMAFPGAPELIFGCGGLGNGFVGEEAVKELLKTLKEAGTLALRSVSLDKSSSTTRIRYRHVDMLADFIDICEHEGYVKPTVYQGLYNLIDRRPEVPGLDAVVRTHGMQFVAHSPHASDFLHGALTSGQTRGRALPTNVTRANWWKLKKTHDGYTKLTSVVKSSNPYGKAFETHSFGIITARYMLQLLDILCAKTGERILGRASERGKQKIQKKLTIDGQLLGSLQSCVSSVPHSLIVLVLLPVTSLNPAKKSDISPTYITTGATRIGEHTRLRHFFQS
ncbi:aldo/keto reductase, putative [Metarhizium acridum CQMa 102]|uniref:Aldo/keto reductase, putative n=1 Tax=Metarhizium acridum (strain CQMa 102) TaxID=655827 RepID=E9DUA9_METAQ|nr:aldo/keto reductase, putative [Metarhizium acridum CQMa 102]EFY92571.1 aldo/keto reductase, putative [Metarhizium acridum CQMa 102]